jgi:hypothetical protein
MTAAMRLFTLLLCTVFYQTQATNPYIKSLNLYSTRTNPGTNIGPLISGMVVDLRTTGSYLTIVANVSSTIVGYTVFEFDGTFKNNENYPFYALNGNSGTYLNPFIPMTTVGSHTVTVRFYHSYTNVLLDTTSVTFIVVNSSPNNGPFTGFNLVNTRTNNVIGLPSIVSLSEVGTSSSIVATTQSSKIDNVVFWFDNKFVRVENSKPWAINGNDGTTFYPYSPISVPGIHTVLAVAQGFNGDILGNSSFTFIVQAVAPVPSSRPTAVPIATLPPTIVPTKFVAQPSTIPTDSPTRVRQSNEPTELSSVVPTIPIETEVPTAEPTNIPTLAHQQS